MTAREVFTATEAARDEGTATRLGTYLTMVRFARFRLMRGGGYNTGTIHRSIFPRALYGKKQGTVIK
jgi:hypothetical protein